MDTLLELNEVDVEELMLMRRQDRMINFVSLLSLRVKAFFYLTSLRFDHLLLPLLLHLAESLTFST